MSMNDDPLDYLVDLTVVDGKLAYRVEELYLGCSCEFGVLGAEWVYQRKPECTCGAGEPEDATVLHDVNCDTVPCPICPAEESWRNP